jgi:hypothetical protein
MTSSIGCILTQMLQSRGVCPDDFSTISRAVYESLHEMDKLILSGESIVFPSGREYVKR